MKTITITVGGSESIAQRLRYYLGAPKSPFVAPANGNTIYRVITADQAVEEARRRAVARFQEELQEGGITNEIECILKDATSLIGAALDLLEQKD